MGPIDPRQSASYLTTQAEREAALRRVQVERTRTNPDLTGTIGVRRLEREDATAFLLGVSMPLNIFDRNRGNTAAAEADVRAAEARGQQALLELEADVHSAAAAIEAAEARTRGAAASLSIAQETYRLARIAYEAGRSPISELLAARRGVGAARGAVLEADIARFEARASLARLEGRTISGDPVQ